MMQLYIKNMRLPDGTKPLPESVYTFHTIRSTSQYKFNKKYSWHKNKFENKLWQSHFPWANQLINYFSTLIMLSWHSLQMSTCSDIWYLIFLCNTIFAQIIHYSNITWPPWYQESLRTQHPVNMTEMGLKWPNAFLPFSHTWPGYGLPLCLEGAIW